MSEPNTVFARLLEEMLTFTFVLPLSLNNEIKSSRIYEKYQQKKKTSSRRKTLIINSPFEKLIPLFSSKPIMKRQ